MDLYTLEIIKELLKDKREIYDIERENNQGNTVEELSLQSKINALMNFEVEVSNLIIDTLQRQNNA